MKKVLCLIFITVFIGICFVPLAGQIFGYKNVNAEKRELAVLPKLMTPQGLNVGYTKELDDYFTDNFAFRTDLITVNAKLYAEIFAQSVSDKVIIGKDGWLFFAPTVNDYTKNHVLSDNEIYRLEKTLEIQKSTLQDGGISFIFMTAPNKSSIYGQYMPDRFLQIGTKSNAEKLFSAFDAEGFDYLNLFTALRGNDTQLYHKLDTHWNNYGAMIGYNSMLKKVTELDPAFTYDSHEGLVPTPERSWSGDLSAMLYPTSNQLDMEYIFPVAKEYKTDRPIRSMEDLTISSTCETGSENLLMFRDSFANALIPLLSNEFASVTYSRATPYDYSQLQDSTDVVVLEIAERNLPNLLLQAPLLPAAPAAFAKNITPAKMDITSKVIDSADSFRIFGLALPPEYRADKNYDIYIRLHSADGVYTFTAFPILEDGYFKEDTGKANAAFSLMINKSSLPAGKYTMEVVVRDPSGTCYGGTDDTAVITIPDK